MGMDHTELLRLVGELHDPLWAAILMGWQIYINDEPAFRQIEENDEISIEKNGDFISIGLWYNNSIDGISFYSLWNKIREYERRQKEVWRSV
jgi:hypothetical protein